MKNILKNILLFLFPILFLTGCYTQFVISDKDEDEYYTEQNKNETEDEEQSDTISKSDGNTIINNYFYDDDYRYSRYRSSFRYYHPRRYHHWSDWYFDFGWYSDYRYNYNPYYGGYYGWYDPWWDNYYYPRHYNPYYSYYDPYYWWRAPQGGGGNISNAVFRTRNDGVTRGDDKIRTRDNSGGNNSPAIGTGTGTIIGTTPNAGSGSTGGSGYRERTPWWEKNKEEPSTPPKIREERKRTVDEESKPGKKNPDAVKVPEKSKDGKSTPTVKPRERKKGNDSPSIKSNPPQQNSTPPSEVRSRNSDGGSSSSGGTNNSSIRKRDN